MPKIIEPEKRQKFKIQMLKMLGVNARISNNDLAKSLGIPKSTVQKLFKELVKERDLHFTAEIGIEELWRWEFVKQARTYNKKGILENVIDQLPELGFGEFLILLKFIDGFPENEDLVKAFGNSYIPQFIGRLHGDYDLIIYAIARNYDEVNKFVINLTKSLEKSKIISELLNIRRTYGFFPLRKQLVKEFSIPDTYEHILLGLNEDGRIEFSKIGRKFKHGLPHTLYAHVRLLETGILRRATYYEGRPEKVFSAVIQIKILNEASYLSTRNKWLLDMVKSYDQIHTEYTFICDISNPQGMLFFMNFDSGEIVDNFIEKLRNELSGIEIRYFVITKVLIGALGIRDFDMKYTKQYVGLESDKLVPKFNRSNR